MCEYAGKLIAWFDHELLADEAGEVEEHVQGCAECRTEFAAYKRVSNMLDAYCEATMEASAPHPEPLWKPSVLGVGAVAALLALFLAWPGVRETRRPASGASEETTADPASSIAKGASEPIGSVISSPLRRARHLSPIGVERKRDFSAKGHPRTDNRVTSSSAVSREDGRLPVEPAIEITFPAEAVLPPGAAPEGVNFVADVSIAADGSPQQIFVRP